MGRIALSVPRKSRKAKLRLARQYIKMSGIVRSNEEECAHESLDTVDACTNRIKTYPGHLPKKRCKHSDAGFYNVETASTSQAELSKTTPVSQKTTNVVTQIQTATITDCIDDSSVRCVTTVEEICDNKNIKNMQVSVETQNVTDNDAPVSETFLDIHTDSEMLHDESAEYNLYDEIDNETLHVDGNIDAFRLRPADISGRCIVDFGHVFAELQRLSNHWIAECRLTDLCVTQTIRSGLKTQFFVECRMCHFKNSFWSEPTFDEILDVNRGAVCGTILTGTGHKQLEQLLAAMDVPCMSNKTYLKYHNEMSEAFAAAAEEEMRVAGEEEKRLAIERGDVIDGIPHIPVITDGSWMKRSYRTGSYDSPSGAAIITGYYSKKVLFVSVRNRYCSVCARASKENVEEHVCYKNWGNNQSSTSMESDIILEGFRRSVDMHGLIFSKFIGDGDSNVSKKLRDFAPYDNFGIVVEKIECTNHLLRNLCNKIREIGNTGDRSISKLKKVVANSVMKIRNAVVKAASHRRNSDASKQQKIALLIKDLQNIPSHVFGEHKICNSLEYFCTGERKEGEENLVPQLISAGLYIKIEHAMQRIIENANSILYKFTSNSVETCNGIISKFIGGKRIHFARRGSYETRVKAAIVQYNTKETLSKTCHAIGKVVPSQTEIIEKRKIVINNKYHEQVRVAKEIGASVRTSKQYAKTSVADKDYGPNAERPDVDGDMYEQLKRNHFEMLLNQQKNRIVLEYATRGQHANPQWHHIRQKLLTASNFGKVCSRRETTSCKNLVKSILYPPRLRNAPVEWGREKEKIARQQLQVEMGVEIDDCGLFIDSHFPYLAATPDGIIGDDTIVEIKCPYAARQMSPTDAMLNQVSDIHRIFDKNDDTCMNKKHAYYFQVQGQLHITQRQYCVFAVWTPLGLKCVIEERDDIFWEECMSAQLQRFYENCMVPEIIDSRAARNMPIREPQYVIEAQAATQMKSQKSLLNDK